MLSIYEAWVASSAAKQRNRQNPFLTPNPTHRWTCWSRLPQFRCALTPAVCMTLMWEVGSLCGEIASLNDGSQGDANREPCWTGAATVSWHPVVLSHFSVTTHIQCGLKIHRPNCPSGLHFLVKTLMLCKTIIFDMIFFCEAVLVWMTSALDLRWVKRPFFPCKCD